MGLDLPTQHFDAVESYFIESEIEAVQLASVDLRTAAQDIREFIPTDNQMGATDNTYSYETFDRVGAARIIAGDSDDLPRVDVFAAKKTGYVVPLGNAYGWNILEDLLPAAAGRKPLPQERAVTARIAFDQFLKRIAMVGSTKHNIYGLLNHPNVGIITLPDGAANNGSGWEADSKTADEILADLFAMVDGITGPTNDEEKPDTLLLPKVDLDTILRRRIGDTDASMSIYDYFLETAQKAKTIQNIFAFSGLEGAGVSGKNRAVMYRKAPDVLKLIVPMDFTPQPPQLRGLKYLVNNVGKTGGVIVLKAKAITYADY